MRSMLAHLAAHRQRRREDRRTARAERIARDAYVARLVATRDALYSLPRV